MRLLRALIILFVLSGAFTSGLAHAQASDETASKTADSIKWSIKITPLKSMADLYLTDSRTDKPIIGAKVTAVITMPDGRKLKKELKGMKMGSTHSYMNTLDLRQKGRYIFDVSVTAGKRHVKFTFPYEVKQDLSK